MRLILAVILSLFVVNSFADGSDKDNAGGDERWNITGPAWYDTKCGHLGIASGVGVGENDGWVAPCSIPVRVCVFERVTISTPALPDVECRTLASEASVGKLKSTALVTW